jgi:hypothetical protein
LSGPHPPTPQVGGARTTYQSWAKTVLTTTRGQTALSTDGPPRASVSSRQLARDGIPPNVRAVEERRDLARTVVMEFSSEDAALEAVELARFILDGECLK